MVNNIISALKSTHIYKKCVKWYSVECYVRKEAKALKIEAIANYNSKQVKKQGSLKDYKKAWRRHLVSFSEYEYQYEFWNKTEKQRNEFVSRLGMRKLYVKYRPHNVYLLCRNKVLFLRKFQNFIHRPYIVAKEVDFNQFQDFVSTRSCIVKPIDEAMGKGIFRLDYKEISDMSSFYALCKEKNYLIEECVSGCEEIQVFHPSSLNSIRVVTISSGMKSMVFGAFLRMGRGGSVVDNAHAGGLFAQINVETGVVESEGISVDGERYKYHPDTKKQIVGFQIPRWNEIKDFCLEATRVIPNLFVIGWDVIINGDGQLEFVEGNGGPDFDVMQSPLKIGVKTRLQTCLDEVFDGKVKYSV